MKPDRGDLIRLDITVVDSSGKQNKVSFDAGQINAVGEFYFNSTAYGGEILLVEMEIEYPDGSTKIVGHGPKWADITRRIIIDTGKMDEKHMQILGQSPDWQLNHAMIRELADGTFHSICLRAGHSGDDQVSFISALT
jgi:hypothetical protein